MEEVNLNRMEEFRHLRKEASISFPVIENDRDPRSKGADGPDEKDLCLPARSRFGEGRGDRSFD